MTYLDAGERDAIALAEELHADQLLLGGLNPGSGSHSPTGKEGPQEVLAGGQGSLTSQRPQKTVGSYWPYATTLWDYINRAMPFDHPGTMTTDEIYGATAYLLYLNGIVKEQDVVNQASLPQIKMPNREGFVVDPRPDIPILRKKKP